MKVKITLFILLLAGLSQHTSKSGVATNLVAGLAGISATCLLPTEKMQKSINNFFTGYLSNNIISKINNNTIRTNIAKLYNGQSASNYAIVSSSLLAGYSTYKIVKYIINKIDGEKKNN